MASSSGDAGNRVLIVGAGPVGLALSLVLTRYDVPSLIIESRQAPTPRDESRAITWMPRGLELLDWLGLGADFQEQGLKRFSHDFWVKNSRVLKMSFDNVDSPHRYTLQLPQHDSETLLESAALATGLVEIRRGHRVVAVGGSGEAATAEVEGPDGRYSLSAPWAVACDGAGSTVRKLLGIDVSWKDYGTHSAVADFVMECDLPREESRIVLDPARPYGFFYFAMNRWRFVYRLNEGEDRNEMVTESAATDLLLSKLPSARVKRFLWASAFRLGQGQSNAYRKGRWLLAGDAAHAMGPSAGAGMMIGVLSAWRLGWRLALAFRANACAEALLADYEREQRHGSNEIQGANARIFRNMALKNRALAALRGRVLRILGGKPRIVQRMTDTEALVAQVLPVGGCADAAQDGPWEKVQRVGVWEAGRRMPWSPQQNGGFEMHSLGPSHALVRIESAGERQDEALSSELMRRSPVPAALVSPPAEGDQAKVPMASRSTVALVRPDLHVAAIYRSRQ